MFFKFLIDNKCIALRKHYNHTDCQVRDDIKTQTYRNFLFDLYPRSARNETSDSLNTICEHTKAVEMEIVDVDPELNSELMSYFRGMKDGFVQVGEKKWFFPKKMCELADEYKNFEVRPDDIWITGYPRSGTTLTEELAWILSHDLDFEEAAKIDLPFRVRFFEGSLVTNNKFVKEYVADHPSELEGFQRMNDTLKLLDNDEKRRVIKTHLPFDVLPEDIIKKGCKVIYVCRYPKDVSVSHFFLQSNLRHIDFCGDFKQFWKYFRNGNTIFGPYFEHVKQGFERIGTKNFLFVFYEDFLKDKGAYIKNLSEFLEVPITEKQLEKLEEYIGFENFQKSVKIEIKNKDNEIINFVRKGKAGGWRDHFTEEMVDEADEWIQEMTRKIGIEFPSQKD